jgi:hypothetical protein
MCNENIPSFLIHNDNSVIESMIIKDLCYKQIIDINIHFMRMFRIHTKWKWNTINIEIIDRSGT